MLDVRSLVMLSRTIGAEHNVAVVFTAGETASCSYSQESGRYVIKLPISDKPDADLLYRGYIDHEVGHVRFTEFRDYLVGDPVESQLMNIFEDTYVERRMSALFPGCKVNLRNLSRHVFNEEHVDKVLRQDAASVLFAYALYHRRMLQYPELGHSIDRIDQAVRDLGVPPDAMAAMLEIIEKPASSTTENVVLVHDLYVLFQPYLNGQSQGGTGSGQPGDQDQDAPGDQGQDQGSSGGKEQDGSGLDAFSVSGCVENELGEGADSLDDSLEESLFELSGLVSNPVSFKPDRAVKDMLSDTVFDDFLVSALRKRIPPLLQTSRIKPCVISSRGRLYGKRLARTAVLDANVFHAPGKKLEQVIEVGFLSDYSGSMGGESARLDRAVFATLVMLKGLPAVKSFAYGFNGVAFRKLCDKNTQRLSSFRGLCPISSTPMSAAMLGMMQEFDTRGRRIMLVTTDGRPDGGVQSVQHICQMLIRAGIELYGIGLGSAADYLPNIFGEDHSAVVESIHEYPAQLEKLLRKALLCAA